MHLIVGLGNPGRVYRNNRHNVGFMLIDKLAEGADKRFEQFVEFSLTCRLDLCGQEVILAKPQTFMNLSGRAVKELLGHESLSSTQGYTHVQLKKMKKDYKKSHPLSK